MIRRLWSKLSRQLAIATAQRNARTIIQDGYKFIPVNRGYFDVYRPDNQGKPAYGVQIYRNRATEKMTYDCNCKFFKMYGLCKHGDGLVIHLQDQVRIVNCAEAAPEPELGTYRLGAAVDGPDTMRFGGLVWQPVSGIWQDGEFYLSTGGSEP